MIWSFFNKAKTTATDVKVAKANSVIVTDDFNPSAQPASVPLTHIKRLLPVSQVLTDAEMAGLSITQAEFNAGEVMFRANAVSQVLIYLVSGTAYLETTNGSGQEVFADTLNAFYPLVSGDKLQFTGIAKTRVKLIYIPDTFMQPKCGKQMQVPQALQDNRFFQRFYPHFERGDLPVPSFPDVAFKIHSAIQHDLGIPEIVKIINFDPVLAGKLIQIVNSPLYRAAQPITSCLQAVNRLGLNSTKNLVTTLALKNLMQSQDPVLKKPLHEIWQHSIRVASISHILAKKIGHLDPDEALLAGLIHNIGALPIVMYAKNLGPTDYQSDDMAVCAQELQGLVGVFLLNKWEFPESIRQIPLQAANWFSQAGSRTDYADIVLLAKFHHLLALPSKPALPCLSNLPAFQKLTGQPLTPEFSLQVLKDARQQISEAMSIFNK